MNIDKRKICDWLAGTAGSEAMRAVEADVRDRDRSETLAWLARLDDASQRLRQAVDSGGWHVGWTRRTTPFPTPERPGERRSCSGTSRRGCWSAREACPRGSCRADQGAGPCPSPTTKWVAPWPASSASRCYGSPDQAVALTLHVTEDDDEGGQVRAGLEVSPPPLREPLVITVEFGTGDRRTFTAAVPVSPRPSTRSAPCEPLPPGSARARSGVWIDGGWPPVFKLS